MARYIKLNEIAPELRGVDINFLQPLADYFKIMGISNLPIRVANAADSLIALLEKS